MRIGAPRRRWATAPSSFVKQAFRRNPGQINVSVDGGTLLGRSSAPEPTVACHRSDGVEIRLIGPLDVWREFG
jgi:hypothetical protein